MSAEISYARWLATAIWERHWKQDYPDWRPAEDMMGLLSQIDQMVFGMERKDGA